MLYLFLRHSLAHDLTMGNNVSLPGFDFEGRLPCRYKRFLLGMAGATPNSPQLILRFASIGWCSRFFTVFACYGWGYAKDPYTHSPDLALHVFDRLPLGYLLILLIYKVSLPSLSAQPSRSPPSITVWTHGIPRLHLAVYPGHPSHATGTLTITNSST